MLTKLSDGEVEVVLTRTVKYKPSSKTDNLSRLLCDRHVDIAVAKSKCDDGWNRVDGESSLNQQIIFSTKPRRRALFCRLTSPFHVTLLFVRISFRFCYFFRAWFFAARASYIDWMFAYWHIRYSTTATDRFIIHYTVNAADRCYIKI